MRRKHKRKVKRAARLVSLAYTLRDQPAIRRAVLGSLRSKHTGDETAQFARIEALRHEITQADRPVEMVYYGVTRRTQGMSEDELRAGVKVEETTKTGVPRISAPPWKAQLLFRLVRECRPTKVLELGTGYGISGLYQLAAVELNGHGHFYTVDGSGENMAIASELFERLGSDRWTTFLGPLRETLPGVLERTGTVDMVFVDADHGYAGTMYNFETTYPYVSDGGIWVFDDVTWSPEMWQAWQEISRSEKAKNAVQVREIGICVKARPRVT
jgi:predicted O-methyltransferase YrrM